MARLSRKELKKDEVRDAAFDFGHWLEENWRGVLKVAVPVVVVALLVAGWMWNERRVARHSRELLAQGIHEFDQAESAGFSDSARLDAALDLFNRAESGGGKSETAQVARYYRGVTLSKLGRTDEAIACLEAVDVGEPGASPTLGAAKALLADLLVKNGQPERAIELLEGIASHTDSTYPPELALLQLGRIYRDQGDDEQARESWSRIVEEYPQSPAAAEAGQLLGS